MIILTYKIKHYKDFSNELKKAKQIAEFAIKTKSNTSKDVKHFGLKSVIANQILRKYGRNKDVVVVIKKIKSVKLTIPNQGISLDRALRRIKITSLKLILNYIFPNNFKKINQIELDNQYAYVSVSIDEEEKKRIQHNYNNNTIGVDLNTTKHIAVVSNPETGKIWKLGKTANHIHEKYKNIRRMLQKKGKYRNVKCMKNRENRIIKNLNHNISKKIINIALDTKSNNIRFEKLDNIRRRRQTSKISKKFRYSLNSWSYYQLQKFVEYKARLHGIIVSYIDPQYTSQTCSRCGLVGERKGKNFKCPSGHVDHADVNASFNIGKPIKYCIFGLGQSSVERDILEGNTDIPKNATLIRTTETLEPQML